MPVIRADRRSGRAVESFTLVLTKPAVAPRFRQGRGFGSVRIEFNQTVAMEVRHPHRACIIRQGEQTGPVGPR